jgi:hypothetical protein
VEDKGMDIVHLEDKNKDISPEDVWRLRGINRAISRTRIEMSQLRMCGG